MKAFSCAAAWIVLATLSVVADDYMHIKDYDTKYDDPKNTSLSIQKLQLQLNHVKGDVQHTMETSAKHTELEQVSQKTEDAHERISRLKNEVDAIDYENLKRDLNKKVENTLQRINAMRSELTQVIRDNKDALSKMLKTEVSAMKAELDMMGSDMQNLQSDLSSSKSQSAHQVASVEERLDSVNQNLLHLSNKNRTRLTQMLNSEIGTLEQKVKKVDSQISQTKNNLAKHIHDLEEKNYELEQKIAVLERMLNVTPKPVTSKPKSVSKAKEPAIRIRPDKNVAVEDYTLKKFEPTTFKIIKTSPVLESPNGKKLGQWESGKKFTAFSIAGKWIKVSGIFLNKKWTQLPRPIWVDKDNVRAL